jgi:hypothetical protein
MGCYVNPRTESKESFLDREGTPLTKTPTWSEVPEGSLPVCLVANPRWTAAGVAYFEGELQAFADPFDNRPKRWYFVPIAKLLEVSDLTDYRRDLLVQ